MAVEEVLSIPVGPFILVVESDPDLLETYERALQRLGRAVIRATTRRTALEAIGRASPLAIVIEIELPDGDGFDVIESVRKIDADCPVVVVTRLASNRGRRRALDAGAAAYLVKPFSVPDLVALVAKVIHGRL